MLNEINTEKNLSEYETCHHCTGENNLVKEVGYMISNSEYEKLKETKRYRCKFCHQFMGKTHDECHCVVDGWEDENVKTVSHEDCEACDKYDCRFIEYPVTINGIQNEDINTDGIGHACGALCEVRPCGDEYGGKSYIGIYVGELPIGIMTTLSKDGVLKNCTVNNPAIFVPELRKLVYGRESWWHELKSIDDFKGISDDDIENTWYVKLLRSTYTDSE